MDKEQYIKTIAKSLKRSLVIYDLETTDADSSKCQAIQFSGTRIEPNSNYQELSLKFLPSVPIHPEASKVHGVKIEDLENEKPFETYAKQIANFFKGADIGGYNNARFDDKIIARQLKEAGYPDVFKDALVYDAYPVYMEQDRRRLANAVRFYLKEEITNAHTATGDVVSTIGVIAKQIEKEQLPLTEIVAKFATKSEKALDQYVITENGVDIWNFSKHKGTPVSEAEIGFLKWILKKGDFPQVLTDYVKKHLKTRK